MPQFRSPLRTLALCAVLAVGVGSFGYSSPLHLAPAAIRPAVESAATPRPALPHVVESEPEAHRVPVAQLRADSDIADEAARPIRRVVQVDRGDTLMDLLQRAGVERAEAHQAIAALREVYNPRALKIGQEVTVTFERPADGIGEGPFRGVSLQPEADRQVSARRDADGFAASEIKHATTRELARFSGTIESSLFDAATQAGVPVQTLVEVIRALSYDVDFQRDLQPGDRFEVMFERHVDKKGQLVRDGDVLYASLTLSGTPVTVYRYVDLLGKADYYNAAGESVRKALLRTPVDGARLSSGFGKRRHPVLGYTKMHKGVDFAAPTGTPIYAAGDGVVAQAGANGGYGYYIRINHNSEYATAYAHLSRFAQGIRAGKQIRQGQVIGYVGSTGRSTGPHLHYEILVRQQHVNPLSVKFASGTKLAGKELNRFLAEAKGTQRIFADLPESSKVAAGVVKTKAN